MISKTILVIEDSRTQAVRVKALLEGQGYTVELASNGREGLEAAERLCPDLIISDVIMPEMDGYELCRAIKSSSATNTIPIILLTQQGGPADIIRGLEAGADNFITKPFEDDYLITRVSRILEQLELRARLGVQLEVLVTLGERQIRINADKQQIMELLFATSEELGRANEQLTEARQALEEHAANLEEMVQKRTAELQEALQTLERTMQERRELASLLIEAQEEERQRIAHDVHDDPIQVMAAAGLRLSLLEKRLASSEDAPLLAEVQETMQLAIDRLRHLMFDLLPQSLENQGLGVGVHMYMESLQRESGPRYILVDNLEREPALIARITAYRIVKEALINARKHADASKIVVHIENDVQGILVRVTDDGRGASSDELTSPAGHLGIRAMRERVELADGWLRIESTPGEGTEVSFWLPDRATS